MEKTNSIPETLKAGDWFSAKIDGTPVKGRVQKENGEFFLCQNSFDGNNCDDKQGFKYSWTIRDGLNLKSLCVTDFKVLAKKPRASDLKEPLTASHMPVFFNSKFVRVYYCSELKDITHDAVRKIAKFQKLSDKAKERLVAPIFNVDNFDVTYYNDYITVGCQKVTNEQLKAIVAYLDKKYPKKVKKDLVNKK
jgi:hypothetical protein